MLTTYGGVFDIDVKAEKQAELEKLSLEPDFWDDSLKAQGIMREVTRLRDEITLWDKLRIRLSDALELVEIDDPELLGELVQELVNGKQPAGFYNLTWNGTGMNGQRLTSGIYFYRLSAGNYKNMKKLVLAQ